MQMKMICFCLLPHENDRKKPPEVAHMMSVCARCHFYRMHKKKNGSKLLLNVIIVHQNGFEIYRSALTSVYPLALQNGIYSYDAKTAMQNVNRIVCSYKLCNLFAC